MFQDVIETIDRRKSATIRFLQNLISTASNSREEAAVSRLIADKLGELGIGKVEIDKDNNITGIYKGERPSIRLVYDGHMDTVPPTPGMEDPYSAKIMDGAALGSDGDVIFGRGAADMKGSLAAMIAAAEALKEEDVSLKKSFCMAFVTNEEYGPSGTRTLIAHGLKAETAMIGEPTNLNIGLGHRGTAHARIVVKGKSAHASLPEYGVNALYQAIKYIDELQKDLFPKLPTSRFFKKTDMAVTKIELNPGLINIIPDQCTLEIDCRNTPNYSEDRVLDDLNSVINKLKAKDPKFEAEASIFDSMHGRPWNGFFTNPETPVIQLIKRAFERINLKRVEFTTTPFGTDGRAYAHLLEIPTFIVGPGDYRFIHGPREHVRIREVISAAKIYASIVLELCG